MLKATSGGKQYPICPAGVTQAVCVDVIDLGITKSEYQGEEKSAHKINIVWQVEEKREDGKRFLVYKRNTLSLHPKATLRKDIESWRGKSFSKEEEEEGFNVEDIKGWQCLLNIQHNEVGDKTYANVVSIMPLPKGMPKMVQEEYARFVAKGQSPASTEPELVDLPDDEDIPF